MTSLLIAFIRLYKVVISPVLPFNRCRYYPTCSEYAIDALQKFGTAKGTLMAVKRIARCHPFSKHAAYDPVP